MALGKVVVELNWLYALSRFFSRILTSARLSAARSFFSSSESSASSSDSCSSTAVQPAGLLSAKLINFLRLVMRVFTLASSDIAAERSPFRDGLDSPVYCIQQRAVELVLYFVSLEVKRTRSLGFRFQLLELGVSGSFFLV